MKPIYTVVCILVGMNSFPRFPANHPWCRNKHCYQRIDLPVKKGPLLIYGCAADLLNFTIKSDGIVFMLFEYVPMCISVH